MPLAEGHKTNFNTMLRAAKAGHLALMECTDAKTGEPRAVVCMVGFSDGEYVMTPVVKMFDGDPYEELVPPMA